MDAITSAIVLRALDGLHRRFAFTAQNIANANSPDYRPVRVSFEDSLRTAAAESPRAVRQSQDRVYIEDPSSSEPMRLDLELATASRTAGRYRALIDILSRQMQLDRAVVSGGR